MAYRPIDKRTYELLLAAYRERPGDVTYASVKAGCHRRMAARGWSKGWLIASRGISYPPIKETVHDEQVATRAAFIDEETNRVVAQEDVREKARADAIQSRKDMGTLLAAAGSVQGGAIQILGKLLPAAIRLAEQIGSRPDELATLPLRQRIAILNGMIRSVALVQESVRDYQTSVRTHFGEPEKIIGIAVADMTPEQMIREIDTAYQEAQVFKAALLPSSDGASTAARE